MNWAVHAARAGLAEDATSKYHRGAASTSSRQAWGRGGPGRPNELTVPQLTTTFGAPAFCCLLLLFRRFWVLLVAAQVHTLRDEPLSRVPLLQRV